MKAPPYTITNDSVVVVYEGKSHVVQRGAPNFLRLRDAIADERWEDVEKNLTVGKSIRDWAKGRFTISNAGNVLFDNEQIPQDLNSRIVDMAAAGENPDPLFKFYERLSKNPSNRSVAQLFPFLKQIGIPLTDDGKFLAYKAVRGDLKDIYSGKFDNSPGAVNKIPRNQVSDDPQVPCHEGFHVGALQYARSFGGSDSQIVICEVDPENVVCVPYDSDCMKMRVCEYKVVGFHNGDYMPSTSIDDNDIPDLDAYDQAEYEDTLEPCPACGELEHDCDCGCSICGENDCDGRCDEPIDEDVEEQPLVSRGPKHKFDHLLFAELMEQTIEELRKYASKNLLIVGASKILGGKLQLVNRILAVRK